MQATTILNTDSFSPHTQQALVLSLFEGLREGSGFVVQSRLEPTALCSQLEQLAQPNLHWEFVKKAAGEWKIRIEKRARSHADGGCCGSCGG